MKLDQEKFKAIEELVEIGSQISAGRSELEKLSKEKDIFLEQREIEAQKRVDAVLHRSEAVIKHIDTNYHELVEYKKDLVSFAESVTDFFRRLVSLREDFDEHSKEYEKSTEEKGKKLDALLVEIRKQQSLVEADRKEIAKDRRRLSEEERAIKDKRETLDRAWSEFNRLKNKKNE